VSQRAVAAVALVAFAACKPPAPTPAPDAGSASVTAASAAHPLDAAVSAPAVTSPAPASPAASDDAAPNAAPRPPDAGASCRVVYGPEPLGFRGAVALAVEGSRLVVVANDGGKPRTESVAIPAVPPRGATPRPSGLTDRAPVQVLDSTPCELAGATRVCPARDGAVRRYGPAGERLVGMSRPGTRVAAATVGTRTAIAFLVERPATGQGETVLHARVALDDAAPVRLSDDGGGATQLALVSLGDKAVALTLDARMAMTPVHARELSVGTGGALTLGPDAVLAIGGPAERGVALAAGRAGADVFALVPLPSEITTFGMTTLKVPSPPRADVPVVLSRYPNGLDPAPLAATHGGKHVYIARVVPESAAPHAARALELGRLAPSGQFLSYGLVARTSVTDVAIVEDNEHALWVGFGDGGRTWLARFVCPPG